MAWLVPSVIAASISTILLVLIYFLLFLQDRKKYLAVWAVGWSFYLLRFISMLWIISGQKSLMLLMGNQLCSLISVVFLLWGTYNFIDKKFNKIWIYTTAIGAAWIIFSIFFKFNFLIMAIPTYTFLAIISIWTGLLFYKSNKTEKQERSITGIAFILWGIHKLDYPFLRPVIWFAPWGYFLGATLELIVALGILMVYFRKARNKLSVKKEKYRILVENQSDLVINVDLKEKFQFVSPSYCEMFGKTEKELIGKIFIPLVHKDDKKSTEKKMEALLHPPYTDASIKQRVMTQYGWKWIAWMYTAVLDKKKNIISIIGTGRDITERKKAEEINKTLFKVSNAVNTTQNLNALFKSIHNSLDSIVDVTNFFIAMVDFKKRTLHFSYHVDTVDDDFAPITDFDPNKSLTGLVATQRKPLLLRKKELEKRAKKEGVWGPVPFIWMGVPLIIKDEVIGVIAVQSYLDENVYNEQDLAVLSMVSDQISLAIDRKRAEESLIKSEDRYRLIADNVADIIWTTDMDFNFTYISPSVYALRGYTVEEAMKQTLAEVVLPESLEMIMDLFIGILKLIESGNEEGFNPVEFEIQQFCKDGSVIWTSNHARILPDSQKKPISVLGITHDITERKQAENEKIKAQKITAEQNKLALVGKIAGKMAHDFNNILGIIMGNTELSLLECKDPQTRETLELIFEQTLRGKNLTRNLVAFAKDQEPKQQFFSINKKIELVLNLLRKDLEGIDEIREAGHGIPDLLADPGMIEHALVNLVQNSIHAISMVEEPRIIIKTFYKNKNIYIEIKDNGCGIPKEALDKIFEPAFTMKGSNDITHSYKVGIKGTGYGMTNVKKYIEQHQGNILIDTKVGKGTKVTISIPAVKKDLTKKEIIQIQKKPFYFKKYILLIEDEQAISDVQYKILTHEPCNHKVDLAATGQMAVELFDKNQYDLISLDYILPGELNGMDVYKHIRQTDDTIPILFVSGNLEFLESIKALKNQDPYSDHISKPCQNKNYINAINDLLNFI